MDKSVLEELKDEFVNLPLLWFLKECVKKKIDKQYETKGVISYEKCIKFLFSYLFN